MTTNDYIDLSDLLESPQAAVGKSFHHEEEMLLPDTPFANALTEIASVFSDGQPDIISIDGRVVYCDNEFAVVDVHYHSMEYGHFMFSFEETAARFPDFKARVGNRGIYYLWISLKDGYFVMSDPDFEGPGVDAPEDLEETIMDMSASIKRNNLTISLPLKEILELAPNFRGQDDAELQKGINRAVQWMEMKECAILTAWRDGNTRAQNDSANKDLQHSLRDNGFGVIKVKGVADWGKEDSFITFNLNDADSAVFYDAVFNLSAKYHQDCFLYKEAGALSPAYLVGTNDSFGIGRKESLGLLRINEMSPEAYSEVGSGTISFTKDKTE